MSEKSPLSFGSEHTQGNWLFECKQRHILFTITENSLSIQDITMLRLGSSWSALFSCVSWLSMHGHARVQTHQHSNREDSGSLSSSERQQWDTSLSRSLCFIKVNAARMMSLIVTEDVPMSNLSKAQRLKAG